MIETLKNGLSVVSSIDLDNWDLELPQILFGYRCGVQANTKFSPLIYELILKEMMQLMVVKLKLISDYALICVEECGPSTVKAMQKLCCMKRQIRISRIGRRKNHGKDEKAKKKERAICKLGKFVCLCEVQG